MAEERVYVIPLRYAYRVPRKKRSSKAIRLIRQFVKRHMKAIEVKIGEDVNKTIWSRGIEKPPRKIRVKVVKDKEGVATVNLAEVHKNKKSN